MDRGGRPLVAGYGGILLANPDFGSNRLMVKV
jgi:hypothetical protein